MTPASPISRGLFGALAVIDAAALVYLVVNYGWASFHIPHLESLAALVIIPLLWVFAVGEKLFFGAFFVAIGAGIVRELIARSEPPRWRAVLASLVLVLALAGIAVVWTMVTSTLIEGRPGFLVDRLTFFDSVAKKSDAGDGMFGFSRYAAGWTGAFLVYMLVAAYLAEKYLLAWWRVRWPLPLSPLIAIGWMAWSVHQGEQAQRAWVAAQQWRPVADQQPWLDAVAACESIGAGWRLPRRAELSHYLATQPADIQGWKGVAWTSSAAAGGSRAIAVDLKPRKSGRWDKRSEPLRDESPCEMRDLRGYANDWVADLRPRVCEYTLQSPALYTPGLKIIALQRGNVQFEQPPAATICMSPTGADTNIGGGRGRGYPKEQEFTRLADFKSYMAKQCRTSPNVDIVACFAFAPDLPGFEQDGDERTMRTFCDLARNAEGCFRYALSMDRHSGDAERADRYRVLACTRGYQPACGKP